MRKPKLRELKEAIKALVKGPYTVDFPRRPAEVSDRLRAKPKFNEDDCIGCGACAEVCPANAIEVVDDTQSEKPVRRLSVKYGECIFCGQCERYCTTGKGIKQTTDFDTATFNLDEARDTVEKELVLCELCGEVIGTKEHIIYVASKIGSKRYANPTLIQLEGERLGLIERDAPVGTARAAKRPDAMRVLCPQCRREVIVREVWGL